jgi:hypothetical protein
MRFRPRSFQIGLGLAALGFSMLLIAMLPDRLVKSLSHHEWQRRETRIFR